jgi:hypothetical protein
MTTECRALAGQCDVAESCTGSTAACPADVFAPPTQSCDDGLFCIVGEHCTGTDPIDCVGEPRDCSDQNVCSADVCNEDLDKCENPTTQPPCEGKMTGGGQVLTGGKRSFGFNAKGEALVVGGASGHFNYVNHVTGVKINGPVTFIYYATPLPNGGEMKFQVTTAQGCKYDVTTKDQIEPGSKPPYDFLTVQYVSGPCPPETTSGSQRLDNGNIQWHNQ